MGNGQRAMGNEWAMTYGLWLTLCFVAWAPRNELHPLVQAGESLGTGIKGDMSAQGGYLRMILGREEES